MAELSDVLMMKALEDDNGHDTWGSAGFLWVILIFLFFLAFNGGGLFGNRGFGNGAAVAVNDLSQVEHDVLTGNCATQKEVLENRYANQLSFNQLGSQMQSCCCDIKTTIIEQNQLTYGQSCLSQCHAPCVSCVEGFGVHHGPLPSIFSFEH